MNRSILILIAAALLTLPACGGVVVDGASAGATGAGGAASATASVASTSASASSVTTGAGGAGGGPATCGGEAGITCSPGEVCDFSSDDCGGGDSSGICKPAPVDCTLDCPGVCGCNGKFYCNACAAHAAGIDVGSDVPCVSPAVKYSASMWIGNLDHMILRMADPVRDICLQLHVDAPMNNGPNFAFSTPPEWGVQFGYISHHASECDGAPGGPDSPIAADGGQGVLSWVVPPGKFYPCEVSFKGTMAFPGAPPWVHFKEAFDASNVPLDGCQ